MLCKSRRVDSKAFWIGIGVLAVALIPAAASTEETVVALDIQILRDTAKLIQMPTFPVSSVQLRHSGCAVVQLKVSTKGDVVSAEVLEAPDGAIAESVRLAVKQWKFYPTFLGKTPVMFMGRLIFYFELAEGKPRVIEAVRASHSITAVRH